MKARLWIENIITNQALYADFMSWTKEARDTLTTALVKATREGLTSEASAIAGEIAVYDNLRTKIESEMRERTAQVTYAESTQGGK